MTNDHSETAEINTYSDKEKIFVEAMEHIDAHTNSNNQVCFNSKGNYNKFLTAYKEFSNITDATYQNQRAVSAYYSLCHYTKSYASYDDFIKKLKDRLSYDWHHKDPISPSFFRSVLENIASLSDNKTANIGLVLAFMAALTTPTAIISTTAALGIGLVLGLSTAVLSPAFLIAAGIAVITASILAIEAGIAYSLVALQNSHYNLDNLLEGDDTPSEKYTGIDRYSDHARDAQKDLTLRPWMTFFTPEEKSQEKPQEKPKNHQELFKNEFTLGQSKTLV